VEVIKAFEGMPPVFTNEYYSDFHGQVKYMEYNPKRMDYGAFMEAREALEELCVSEAMELFGEFVEVV
jgi:hypothetical protein